MMPSQGRIQGGKKTSLFGLCQPMLLSHWDPEYVSHARPENVNKIFNGNQLCFRKFVVIIIPTLITGQHVAHIVLSFLHVQFVDIVRNCTIKALFLFLPCLKFPTLKQRSEQKVTMASFDYLKINNS